MRRTVSVNYGLIGNKLLKEEVKVVVKYGRRWAEES